MSPRKAKSKSVAQRVANCARERKLTREDALIAYAMDRLLYRLGRSAEAKEFYLKGGVLVANLVSAPHRFTRDIDVARRHGPCDPEEMRRRFKAIIAVPADDGVAFDPDGVRAVVATHDVDGYDGIKVRIRGVVGKAEVDLQIDVGFGDDVVPPAARTSLQPFLDGDRPARVLAYGAPPVIAEKVETLLTKFPAIAHRLKDLLDVVMLADELTFEGEMLVQSLRATFARRGSPVDVAVLDDMASELSGKKWQTDWAAMRKDKSVVPSLDLDEALRKFDAFVRPLLNAVAVGAEAPRRWSPRGPWD